MGRIIGFLKEAEAGTPVKELCRKHGVSDVAFYGRRSRFALGLPTGRAISIGIAVRADPL